ncbi:hypothetical protein NA57DRAFT_79390 [Rhizodiscina lignyota]|uniref:Transcription elongation factor Eaf N-terminal domain-containing protein n=1 Tax=Rhizodiscina lignyota TaxID=1504668 RepID=A0A9P4I9L7_9PEZI|nr:hypothetical protein NA57DRAFT_79390 [Rhizodiscina lignyota]
MASPAVTSSSARPLDPLKHSKYRLEPGDGLLSKPRDKGTFSSIRCATPTSKSTWFVYLLSPDNYKPSQADSALRRSTISPGENDRWNLTLTDSSGDGEAKYSYNGKRKDLKRSYALVFDQKNNICTLQPLASGYTFNIQSTPNEASAAKLAERYPKLKPKEELPLQDTATGADSDAGDLNASADEGNPYDFRHYLRHGHLSRSASPERSAANTPRSDASRATPRATPLQRPQSGTPSLQAKAQPKSRQPLTRAKKSSPPVGTTLSKPRTANAPSVRLDRRASTRPTDSQPPAKKPKTTPRTAAPTGKSVVKSEYYVNSSSDEDEPPPPPPPPPPAPDANDSGLEIDFGDAAPKSRAALGKNKKGLNLPSGTPGHGPVSLRSAMNSANASPAHRVHTPLLKTKHGDPGDGQIIDFGDTSAQDDEEEEDDDDDRGYDEDDEGDDDVEPMTLGSPAHDTSKATSVHPEEPMPDAPQVPSDEDADGDADDDFEADFEAEMQGLASQEEEEMRAAPAVAQGDESEESEEE